MPGGIDENGGQKDYQPPVDRDHNDGANRGNYYKRFLARRPHYADTKITQLFLRISLDALKIARAVARRRHVHGHGAAQLILDAVGGDGGRLEDVGAQGPDGILQLRARHHVTDDAVAEGTLGADFLGGIDEVRERLAARTV